MIGIVGILDDVTKAVPAGFQREGDAVFLVGPKPPLVIDEETLRIFGSSEFASTVLGSFWGEPPALDLDDEAAFHRCLAELADKRLLQSANDISDGGLAVALAESAISESVGVEVDLQESLGVQFRHGVFREPSTHVIVSASGANLDALQHTVAKYDRMLALPIGKTTHDKFEIRLNGNRLIETTVADLKEAWSSSLESALHDHTANEVFA